MQWFGLDFVLFSAVAVLLLSFLVLLLAYKTKSESLEATFRKTLRSLLRKYLLGILLALAVTLALGLFFLSLATSQRMDQIRASTEGFAKTLARELTEHHHENITLETPEDDPAYLYLDQLMTDWIRYNPSIDSLYTMRKTAEGKNIFIMSPGTDYNHDGKIEGELEERDPVGTPYDVKIPELEDSFAGKLTFQYYPTEDKWGTTYSIFCPVYDSRGKQEAILGIDYNVFVVNRELLPTRIMILSLLFIVVLVEYYVFWVTFLARLRHAQSEQTQKKLELLASTDHLTKIYNRNRFEQFLALEIERASRYFRSLSLIIFDIDHYKSINDRFGHQVGDSVLVELAALVTQIVRKNDLVARWGGDEFVIACPELSEEAVKIVVQKIGVGISQYKFSEVEKISCSFGISVLESADTVESLLKKADDELYRSKQFGRNSFSLKGQTFPLT